MSDEISSRFKAIEWSMADYKEFNKMASAAQGRIVQNLAYCCHLNPPDVIFIFTIEFIIFLLKFVLVILGIHSHFRLAQR